MIIDFIYFQLLIVILLVMLFASMFRILREYERGVVFLLGRFHKVKGPGFIILIPLVQQMVRVDLRIVTMDIPSQDLISKDNVTVRVNAVLYFRVLDPQKAIINVENYLEATSQLAQTTMRSVLGQHELDEILSARDTLNADLQRILDQSTDGWGIKVTAVEIKHVDLDESMIRAIARQAEAERSRRAKVIHATGELEASKQLLEAARMLARQPEAIQLRYLQTLTEISSDNSKIVVFPLPMELGRILQEMGAHSPDVEDPHSPREPT
ncbi:slipin family protein [Oceanimonas sp. MB9]|uniref:slipin family protein n=1 Tax=Oceanimonas sp. MB9 TaxID=2588453 RepID=UPI0013F65CBF|nr:slipin family protein [Oceanimonas sp. MB9]NHI01247.1 Modulator of FtsH protease HflK [Oceanimonas sp. MB9]